MEELKQKPGAPTMKLFDDPWQERQMWLVRESGLGATANVPGEDGRVLLMSDTYEGQHTRPKPSC